VSDDLAKNHFPENPSEVKPVRNDTAPRSEDPAPLLTQDGHSFRDLNKNGRLDIYEDVRRPVAERVENLLEQMTLAEKAGLMFHSIISMNADGSLYEGGTMPIYTTKMVLEQQIKHFNVLNIAEPGVTANWVNRLQRLAESTRLGIPVTL
jgi:beta-glucosidase